MQKITPQLSLIDVWFLVAGNAWSDIFNLRNWEVLTVWHQFGRETPRHALRWSGECRDLQARLTLLGWILWDLDDRLCISPLLVQGFSCWTMYSGVCCLRCDVLSRKSLQVQRRKPLNQRSKQLTFLHNLVFHAWSPRSFCRWLRHSD